MSTQDSQREQAPKVPHNIRDALDNSTRLDSQTLDALANIRQQALAAVPQKKRVQPLYWLGTAVAASVIFSLVFFVDPNTPSTQTSDMALADMEWLLESDEVELIENDLEFYHWVNSELEDGSEV